MAFGSCGRGCRRALRRARVKGERWRGRAARRRKRRRGGGEIIGGRGGLQTGLNVVQIDEEGMSVVILRRDYKDEKIEVTVSMANLVGGPEFDDEDGEGNGESVAKDDEEAEDSKHFSRW